MTESFHDLLERGLISKPKPIDKYVEVDVKPYAELSDKTKERKRKKQRAFLRRLTHENKARKALMEKRLQSWGTWKRAVRSPSYASNTANGENDTNYDGYDNCLLSDFDSLMITIEQLVMDLNPIDKDIIRNEYKGEGNAESWTRKYGRSEGRYRGRKSELLLYLSLKIDPKKDSNKC